MQKKLLPNFNTDCLHFTLLLKVQIPLDQVDLSKMTKEWRAIQPIAKVSVW